MKDFGGKSEKNYFSVLFDYWVLKKTETFHFPSFIRIKFFLSQKKTKIKIKEREIKNETNNDKPEKEEKTSIQIKLKI